MLIENEQLAMNKNRQSFHCQTVELLRATHRQLTLLTPEALHQQLPVSCLRRLPQHMGADDQVTPVGTSQHDKPDAWLTSRHAQGCKHVRKLMPWWGHAVCNGPCMVVTLLTACITPAAASRPLSSSLQLRQPLHPAHTPLTAQGLLLLLLPQL
jgi:hypothetical protein